jgi:hypothetical protein
LTIKKEIILVVDVPKAHGHLVRLQVEPLVIVTDHAKATQIDKLKIRRSRHVPSIDKLSQRRFIIIYAKGGRKRLADTFLRLYSMVKELEKSKDRYLFPENLQKELTFNRENMKRDIEICLLTVNPIKKKGGTVDRIRSIYQTLR